jgi:hypothetical protein
MPNAHSDIQSFCLGWRLPVETPKRALKASAFIMFVRAQPLWEAVARLAL